MLKRTVTGAVYVSIITAFFFLRNIHELFFAALICFFCAVGTFEVARAIKGRLYKGNFVIAVIYGILFVPAFCIFQYAGIVKEFDFGYKVSLIIAETAVAYSVLRCVIQSGGKDLKTVFAGFFYNVLPFLYPSLFLLTTLLANALGEKSLSCLLLIFVISPCSDTMAYLVGMTYNKIRKGKAKKMCPVLSPNKTWAGAVGGLVGGILGAVIVYFTAGYTFTTVNGILVYLLAGLFGAVFTEAGDLFESFIKRKVGIKDMGRIMPGHGGIMDRIDGTVFTSVLMWALFALIL